MSDYSRRAINVKMSVWSYDAGHQRVYDPENEIVTDPDKTKEST